MNKLRVGIDLVSPLRFRCMETPGGMTLRRYLFTEEEQSLCNREPLRWALCFSFKEAVSKVLGTGLSIGQAEKVDCTSIQISEIDTDLPHAHLSGMARHLALQFGFSEILLIRGCLRGQQVACAVGLADASPVEIQLVRSDIMRALGQPCPAELLGGR